MIICFRFRSIIIILSNDLVIIGSMKYVCTYIIIDGLQHKNTGT